MTEQGTESERAAALHHGPIRPDCPVACLQVVLSQAAYRVLAHAQGAPFPPPRAVSDVLGLYARQELRDIRGMGPRRISEVEVGLVLAGLDLSGRRLPQQEPPSDEASPPSGGQPTGCPVCGESADFPPSPSSVGGFAGQTAWVLAWLVANCHRRDVTIAEVAEVAGLSPRRLQAVFKRDYGCGPVRLLADIRLHRVHLSLTGQRPAPASLAEAARRAGHSRLTRFRAAYLKRYGRYPELPGQATLAAARPGTAKEY